MNILCIGNSFSQDATRYLHAVADGDIYVCNLCIGGCSLERHLNNIREDKADYGKEENGVFVANSSLDATLASKDWDYISVQQVSQMSGVIDSYEPYLTEILEHIRKKCPNSKIVFHRTWAYDSKSNHEGFAIYNRDRALMYEKIVQTTKKIAEKHSLEIIPCGDAVERARELKEFCDGAELNLNRDGFHLSLDYGRYLASLVMYRFFTGKSATGVTFEPENTDSAVCLKLKEVADSVF